MNCQEASTVAGVDFFTMYRPAPPTKAPPFFDRLAVGSGSDVTPSLTFGYCPPLRTEMIVPSAAEVSIVIGAMPDPMARRLSNAVNEVDWARLSFSMPPHQLMIDLPSESSNVTAVARPLRPLLSFRNV